MGASPSSSRTAARQALEIGTSVHAAVSHLLGGHVGHGADQGGRAADGVRLREARGSRRHAGETEVEYLGAPARRDDDIPRLEVAMDNALLMR
jgi:hypothetical protein